MNPRASGVLGGLVVGVVLVAIALGLYLAGSPADARLRRLDQRRLDDLRGLKYATEQYWTRNKRLPSDLPALSRDARQDLHLHDPTSNQLYDFRALTDTTYELCADFQRLSSEKAPDQDTFWSHGPGRQCFQLDAPVRHE